MALSHQNQCSSLSSRRCTPIEAALTHDNALEVMAGCHLVVDASDNPRTRYLVNDACVLTGKPLVRVGVRLCVRLFGVRVLLTTSRRECKSKNPFLGSPFE